MSRKLMSMALPRTYRGSKSWMAQKFMVPKYQNTYRLESFKPFEAEIVDKIIPVFMEKYLSNFRHYDHDTVIKACGNIAMDIQRAIVKKNFERYKIIVQVGACQRLRQSCNVGAAFLWDADRDNYSTFVFENSAVLAWCNVFGVYYE